MMMAITPEALLVWFVWGFFMGIGWTLGSWLINRLLLSRF